ncbi:hypothetical protein D3C76_1078370 [compost metagenome]
MPQHRLPAALDDHQINLRCFVTQHPHQPRQYHPRTVIRHGQAKTAARLARIEAGMGKQTVELLQGLLQRLDQGLSAGRGLQAPTPAHQQRIGKQFTQLRQGMTDRRLAAVQAHGGA